MEDKGNIAIKRGPWTCVQRVVSRGRVLHVNVVCDGTVPKAAVELAGGICYKPRCNDKSVCFRQVKFKDQHRGYEFSCAKHMK